MADRETDKPRGEIIVSPLNSVTEAIDRFHADHLISLINRETMIDTPPTIQPDNHLQLVMNDISEPLPGLILPDISHVKKLIDFAFRWPRQTPLIIHCWAGVSRSPAAAFIISCALNPDVEEEEIAWALRSASPTAYPNRRLIALADENLGRHCRMIAAIERIGRGALVAESMLFHLPSIWTDDGLERE